MTPQYCRLWTSVLSTNDNLWTGGQTKQRNKILRKLRGAGYRGQDEMQVCVVFQPPPKQGSFYLSATPLWRIGGRGGEHKPMAVFFCCKEGRKHVGFSLPPSTMYLEPSKN